MKALLLALLLWNPAASAGDFEAELNAALKAAKPSVRAAPRIGEQEWRDPKHYRWIDLKTYLGPFGLRLDAGCLGAEGAGYVNGVPSKFIVAARQMHETVQRCAAERVLPATVGLIYARAPKLTVRCDPKACEYPDDPEFKAWACASADKGTVTFKDLSRYPHPSTLFHELMHATKHVDNQTLADHRKQGFHRTRDEVYFWERHCFDLPGQLQRMREELELRVKANSLGETPADLKATRREAFEVCALPFRHNERRALWANEREIAATCDQYADFLALERNLARHVRRLTAEAGAGRPKLTKAEEDLLARARLFLPPSGPYSAKAFGDWTTRACAYYSEAESAGNPSWTLRLCARRLAERAQDDAIVADLFGAGLDLLKIMEVQDYFAALALKADALAQGPGRYEKAVEEAGERKLEEYYRASLKECGRPEIAKTDLCDALKLDAPAMRMLGALFLHWKPKTLR